jgi:hypothetical protein
VGNRIQQLAAPSFSTVRKPLELVVQLGQGRLEFGRGAGASARPPELAHAPRKDPLVDLLSHLPI